MPSKNLLPFRQLFNVQLVLIALENAHFFIGWLYDLYPMFKQIIPAYSCSRQRKYLKAGVGNLFG